MKTNQKKNNTTKKIINSKGHKFVNIFLPVLGSVMLAAGVTGVVLTATKAFSKSDPSTTAHEIKILPTEGWNITCNKQTAKKGDTVKFDVTKISNAEINKVPDYLSIGTNKFLLTKDENITDMWTTGDFVWEFIEDKTVALTLKEEITTEVTWDVGFYLNGGSTTDQGKLYQKIVDNGKITNPPNIAAPEKRMFDKWQISTDLGVTWRDFDIDNDVIKSSSIIRPEWKHSDQIIHRVNFSHNNPGEQLISGLTSIDVANSTLWKDVVKPVIERPSYVANGWYYIDSSGIVRSLDDDTKLDFDKGSIFTVFVNWKEAKGTIKFELKDDKLSYATTPAEFYKIDKGTKLKEITKPTIKGTKDGTKIYYPNGTWLIKDTDDNWKPVNESIEFNSNSNITIAPDWSETSVGQDITTVVTFDAGKGDFGPGIKLKTYTYTQTIKPETTEFGCKWSNVSTAAPTIINAPTSYKLVEDQKWGIELTDDTLLFGNITLRANYTPIERNTYSIQITSDDQTVAWSGTQFYTKEYIGKPEDENYYTLGDLGFIKKETNAGHDDIYSLDTSVVSPNKEGSVLNGWQYYKNSTWTPFTEGSELSNYYSAMYSTKLRDIADSDGNIRIKPVFASSTETVKLFILSNNSNIYISGSNLITIDKQTASAKTLMQIMEDYFPANSKWVKNTSTEYVPVAYTDLLTGKKLNPNSKFTESTAIKVHWGLASLGIATSLVKNLDWESSLPEDERTYVGKTIQPCPWWYNDSNDNDFEDISVLKVCASYYKGEIDIDQLAQIFGYDKPSDLVGLKRITWFHDDFDHDYVLRIIGIEHDTIAEGDYAGKKAVFTFEMENLFCDENGEIMLSYYDNPNANYDYTQSQLRKNLNSELDTDVKFYRKDGTQITGAWSAYECVQSTLYQDGVIKKVKKQVAVSTDSGSTYNLTEYTDRLFPLTATEMAYTDPGALQEGTAYEYWTNNTIDKTEQEQKIARRKKAIVHQEDDIPGYCYALASPITTNSCYTWAVDGYGSIYWNPCAPSPGVTQTPIGVSFAFCI